MPTYFARNTRIHLSVSDLFKNDLADSEILREETVPSSGEDGHLSFLGGPQEPMPFFMVRVGTNAVRITDSNRLTDGQLSRRTSGQSVASSTSAVTDSPLSSLAGTTPTPDAGFFVEMSRLAKTTHGGPVLTRSRVGDDESARELPSMTPQPSRRPVNRVQSEAAHDPLRRKALSLTVSLSSRSFIEATAQKASSAQSVKIEIFFNGGLTASTYAPARRRNDPIKLSEYIFSGRRVFRMAERPWIIASPSNASDSLKGVRRDSKVETPGRALKRWQQIGAALLGDADQRGVDKWGDRPPVGEYLAALARLEMPLVVETMQNETGLMYGVIDVVLSLGEGKKYASNTCNLLEPTRMDDDRYHVKNDENAQALCATDTVQPRGTACANPPRVVRQDLFASHDPLPSAPKSSPLNEPQGLVTRQVPTRKRRGPPETPDRRLRLPARTVPPTSQPSAIASTRSVSHASARMSVAKDVVIPFGSSADPAMRQRAVPSRTDTVPPLPLWSNSRPTMNPYEPSRDDSGSPGTIQVSQRVPRPMCQTPSRPGHSQAPGVRTVRAVVIPSPNHAREQHHLVTSNTLPSGQIPYGYPPYEMRLGRSYPQSNVSLRSSGPAFASGYHTTALAPGRGLVPNYAISMDGMPGLDAGTAPTFPNWHTSSMGDAQRLNLSSSPPQPPVFKATGKKRRPSASYPTDSEPSPPKRPRRPTRHSAVLGMSPDTGITKEYGSSASREGPSFVEHTTPLRCNLATDITHNRTGAVNQSQFAGSQRATSELPIGRVTRQRSAIPQARDPQSVAGHRRPMPVTSKYLGPRNAPSTPPSTTTSLPIRRIVITAGERRVRDTWLTSEHDLIIGSAHSKLQPDVDRQTSPLRPRKATVPFNSPPAPLYSPITPYTPRPAALPIPPSYRSTVQAPLPTPIARLDPAPSTFTPASVPSKSSAAPARSESMPAPSAPSPRSFSVPALSQNCVITYAAPDQTRRVKKERGGWFKEESVLMGVRFLVW